MSKPQKSNIASINKNKDTKKEERAKTEASIKSKMQPAITRIVGVFLLGMSVSVFAQAVPLLYVFAGAFLGIPADTGINMDSMVWLLTSVTFMLVVVYAFIQWLKFVWNRFILHPKPLFKKKEKHVE